MKFIIAAALALSLISCTRKSELPGSTNSGVATQSAPTEMAPPNDLPDPSADLAPPAQVSAAPAAMGVQIAASDRTCKKDSDCQIARVQCSCHCGEAVNKAHAKKYEAQAEEMCKNYSGKMCKMLCRGEAKCVKQTCTYVP